MARQEIFWDESENKKKILTSYRWREREGGGQSNVTEYDEGGGGVSQIWRGGRENFVPRRTRETFLAKITPV